MTEKKEEEEQEPKGKFTLDDVVKGMQYIGLKLQQYDERFAKLDSDPPTKTSRNEDDDEEADQDPRVNKAEDIDSMSNSELLTLISGMMDKAVQKHLKPVAARVELSEEERERAAVREELKEAAAQYEDFGEWLAPIKERLSKNPNLSVDEAYRLARSDNPDKAKEIDEKTANKANANEDEGELFGGLLPTSGVFSDNESMDSEKAAEVAWERTFGNRTPSALTAE